MTLAAQIRAAHDLMQREREAAAETPETAILYALQQVYDGATPLEASCVLDHLQDMGWLT